MILIPYIEMNGSWTIPDDIMIGLYRMMKNDGTDRVFFYSGTVRNENEFMPACRENAHTVVILEESGRPVAIGWLNNYAHKSAHAHWLTFKHAWGTDKTHQAIRETLKYWFHFEHDGEPVFEVLLGIYPSGNRHIDKFAKESGFTVSGRVPSLLYDYWGNRSMDATISYIERGAVWAISGRQ
jgi:hypothetical protein